MDCSFFNLPVAAKVKSLLNCLPRLLSSPHIRSSISTARPHCFLSSAPFQLSTQNLYPNSIFPSNRFVFKFDMQMFRCEFEKNLRLRPTKGNSQHCNWKFAFAKSVFCCLLKIGPLNAGDQLFSLLIFFHFILRTWEINNMGGKKRIGITHAKSMCLNRTSVFMVYDG